MPPSERTSFLCFQTGTRIPNENNLIYIWRMLFCAAMLCEHETNDTCSLHRSPRGEYDFFHPENCPDDCLLFLFEPDKIKKETH